MKMPIEGRNETGRKTEPKQLVMLEGNRDFVFSSRYIREAQSAGVDFFTLDMFVYIEHRHMEENGKSHEGFCFAGYGYYANKLTGVTIRAVADAFLRLAERGLMMHLFCDRRIYRNKTKIWVSTARLSKAVNVNQAIKAITEINKRVLNRYQSAKVLEKGKAGPMMLAGNPKTGDFRLIENPNYSGDVEVSNDGLSDKTVSETSEKDIPKTVTKTVVSVSRTVVSEKNTPLEQTEVGKNAEKPLYVPICSKEQKSKNSPPTKKEYGNPQVNRAFEIWKEVLGFAVEPVGRERQYAWNIMRNKHKGEDWLIGKLKALKKAQQDPEFKYSGVKIRGFIDLHYNSSKLDGWLNEKRLSEQGSAAANGNSISRQKSYDDDDESGEYEVFDINCF